MRLIRLAYFGMLAGVLLGTPTSAQPAEPDVKGLIRTLKEGEPGEQVAAADQLSRMGEKAVPAIPALLDAMAGPEAWVVLAMMDTLAELQPVSQQVLLETFRNDTVENRVRAARAFWSMGTRARDIRPDLVKALEDPEEKVRAIAKVVLEKLDAELAQEKSAAGSRKAGLDLPTVKDRGSSTDWPGFRGPNRDGICSEKGLLKTWPESGPELLWKLETLGRGHASICISGDRFYTTGDRTADEVKKQYVLAFDLNTREELWATPIGEAYPAYGALCAPTLDEDALYVIGTDGKLSALDSRSGRVRWQKDFKEAFGGKMMSAWKYSESPLVDGDRVICTPGGPDAMMAAFHKKTGELIWTCAIPPLGDEGSDGASYSSAILAETAGVRQAIQVVGRGLIGVEAATGKFLWGYNRLANTTASITCPIAFGDYVFTANSYSTGSALLHIRRDGDEFLAEEVYVLPAKTFQNHHGGIVLVDGHVYGGSGLNRGNPACLDFASGAVRWKPKAPASGSACVLYADGHILYRYDRGLVVLVKADPEAFRVAGSFTPPRTNKPAWSYPVIHQGKLYLRDQHFLFCYDIRDTLGLNRQGSSARAPTGTTPRRPGED